MANLYPLAVAMLGLCIAAAANADEEFDDPSIRVAVEPVVFTGRQAYSGQIVKLADGSLFITESGSRSSNGGKTWEKASDEVSRTFGDEFRQGRQAACVMADGTYLGLGMICEMPDLNTTIFKAYYSTDNCQTIEGPVDAPVDHPKGTGGYTEGGEFMPATWVNRVIQARDGTLFASCYGWWRGDETYSMLWKYVPELGMYKYRSWVVASTDHGKTWKALGSPGYWPELGPEGMCEPGIVQLANGELLMLFRNGEGSLPCFQTRSGDAGVTWSKPEKLNSTGCSPQPLLMSNGLLVASHGRPHYYLWVSPDGEGKSWTSRTFIGDGHGYTSIVESSPGELVFVGGAVVGQSARPTWRVKVERVE